jgi:hypothetical protein
MRRLHAAGRVALGLFVTGQLLFLLAANLPGLEGPLRRMFRHAFPDNEALAGWAEGEDGLDVRGRGVFRGLSAYADLTGQPQQWSLFAPNLAEVCSFLVLELRWEGGASVAVASENEPADRRSFFRVGRFRLRRLEVAIDQTPSKRALVDVEAWADQLAAMTHADRVGLHAHTRWLVARYLRDHGGEWPSEVVAFLRVYQAPAPPGPEPWDWIDHGSRPLFRWRPGPPGRFEPADLEIHDPKTGRFVEP